MAANEFPEISTVPPERGTPKSWRLRLVGVWFVVTLGVAAYAIVKPSTTAADLVFLPSPVVSWLDAQFDFRTFVMTMAVCLIPACLLGAAAWDAVRRQMLAAALALLVGLEFLQLWIPSRRFSLADVGYTFAAVVIVESLVLLGRWTGGLALGATPNHDDSDSITQPGRWTVVEKSLFASVCVVLILAQLAYILLAE
ncbi:hypothetical protein [Novipirellula sp.]|uniref:hypothetical protein n=1 Tax=Novipirellula sp. TaxID=2795430 RepID=UPI00356A3EAD